MEKRYVHQWAQAGVSCDDKTRHWTEVRLTVEDLMGMIGCDPKSSLVSLHIDRDGFHMTITADEHQENHCPLADAGGSRSA